MKLFLLLVALTVAVVAALTVVTHTPRPAPKPIETLTRAVLTLGNARAWMRAPLPVHQPYWIKEAADVAR